MPGRWVLIPKQSGSHLQGGCRLSDLFDEWDAEGVVDRFIGKRPYGIKYALEGAEDAGEDERQRRA